MAEETGISWTDSTWNPWQGCTKVSPACKNCYMFREKRRYGQDPETVVRSKPPTFNLPIRGGAKAIPPGSLVFTCSWSDWFHEAADAWRPEAWELVKRRPDCLFLVLTKRAHRIAAHLPADWGDGYPNVAIGVTVEDQQRADERIPHLLAVPARVRFLSCEPLLGPVDLAAWMQVIDHCLRCGAENPPQDEDVCPECGTHGALIRTETAGEAERLRSGERYTDTPEGLADVEGRPLDAIHWVIVGGESGPGARPMHPDWARSLRDQCDRSGVQFHFKQWGEYDANGDRIGVHAAGRLLDGRLHDDRPNAPS